MGKFLNPKDLKANLYRIFKEAEAEIITATKTENQRLPNNHFVW